MSLPDLLAGAVDEEDVVARVDLGSEDCLVVTPTRTHVYRAEGLLSDETVEEYPHDVDRLAISEGRRKAKLTLEYGLDGEETITVPAKRLDDALHPVLAGVLSVAGVTDPGESVLHTFRFSELTLIVTSDRLVKHVGSVVWDEEFEEFHYDDVLDVDFEEGTVATSVVLTLDGRQERFKAPNESARTVREALSEAVCSYHDVGSLAELRLARADESEAEADAADDEDDPTDFGGGLDPLSASPADEEPASTGPDAGTDTPSVEASVDRGTDPIADVSGGTDAATGAAFDESPFEPAGLESDDLADELAALREAVEAQSERLDRQADLIEQLIDELRRGR